MPRTALLSFLLIMQFMVVQKIMVRALMQNPFRSGRVLEFLLVFGGVW